MKKTDKPQSSFLADGEQYIQGVYAKIPPQDKGTVERVVAAGGKVMFSESTHKYMLEIINDKGDMATNLGAGIVQLMLLLLQQTKGNIPLNALTPAASILLIQAMEYVEKTQGGMSMEIFSDALKITIAGLMKKVKEITGDQTGQPDAAQPTAPPAQSGLMNAQPTGGV